MKYYLVKNGNTGFPPVAKPFCIFLLQFLVNCSTNKNINNEKAYLYKRVMG